MTPNYWQFFVQALRAESNWRIRKKNVANGWRHVCPIFFFFRTQPRLTRIGLLFFDNKTKIFSASLKIYIFRRLYLSWSIQLAKESSLSFNYVMKIEFCVVRMFVEKHAHARVGSGPRITIVITHTRVSRECSKTVVFFHC